MLVESWMLSSAGRRGSLVKLLKEVPISGEIASVVATDVSNTSAAGLLADTYEQVPRVTDKDFISRTLEVALRHNVKVIIPTIDPEILVFAENRELFERHDIKVWVSTPEVSQLGWDKWSLFKWLRKNGFPTVDTFELRNLPSDALQGPVIAKPRSGSSGIGVIKANSAESLKHQELDDQYIVQQFASGVEITVDFAVGRAGNPLAIVPRQRIEVRGGEVSKGVTVPYPKVLSVVRDLIEKLAGSYGVLNVQLFYEVESESINIIEINPRFGGGYPLSHRAGANFFDALLRDQRGEFVEELTWAPGTLMLRYDSEVIVSDFEYEHLDA